LSSLSLDLTTKNEAEIEIDLTEKYKETKGDKNVWDINPIMPF
jgi:hypothetical protein